MALPLLFNGVADPLCLYTLGTLLRCAKSRTALRETTFGTATGYTNGWNVQTFTAPLSAPPITILAAADHWVVVIPGLGTVNELLAAAAGQVTVRCYADPEFSSAISIWWTQAQQIKARLVSLGVDGSTPIIFVGHSAGGAIAHCLLHQYFYEPVTKFKHACVSFGSPRAGNDLLYRHVGTSANFRVVNGCDIVTDVPTHGPFLSNPLNAAGAVLYGDAVHGGELIWLNNGWNGGPIWRNRVPHSGRQAYEWVNPPTIRHPLPPVSISDHYMGNYCLMIRKQIEEGPVSVLRPLDLLNQGLQEVDGLAAWETQVTEVGFVRPAYTLPEDRDIDYSSTSGEWDEQATVINAAPRLQDRPGYHLPIMIQGEHSPIPEERARRRRRGM